jgi:tetratricopeptide (TPR) repeat protein
MGMKQRWGLFLLVVLLAVAATSVFGETAVPAGGGAPTGAVEPKDSTSTYISGLALFISLCVAVFNVLAWNWKNLDEAKKALTDNVLGLVTARQKLEEFRLDAGEKFATIQYQAHRTALTDQRQLYLSKALQVVARNKKLSPSYFEYMMLAANLIDLGRTADSVAYYEKSLALAKANKDEIAEAATRRVYGRAQIAAGQYVPGRENMLAAATDFKALATRRAFDRARMLEEAAETYRRLIWVGLQAEQTDKLNEDLSALEALIHEIRDPVRSRAMASALNELRAIITGGTAKIDEIITGGTAKVDEIQMTYAKEEYQSAHGEPPMSPLERTEDFRSA